MSDYKPTIWTQGARRAMFAALAAHPDFGPFSNWPENWGSIRSEFNAKMEEYLSHWAAVMPQEVSSGGPLMQVKYAIQDWSGATSTPVDRVMCKAAALEVGFINREHVEGQF